MIVKDFVLDFDHKVFLGDNVFQCDGLTEISNAFETARNAGAEGEYIIGKTKNGRPINIRAKITNAEADGLQRYFAQGEEHTLYIGNRKINCYCELSKIERSNGNLNVFPVLALQLFAPDPYFYDVFNFGENLAGVQPMFGFPWMSTKQDGFATGYKIFGGRVAFANKGDVAVGFNVKFKAARGTAKNIRFSNLDTGEFIEVLCDLIQDDELEISTITGKKYIKLNGVDIFNQINRKSTFFSLSKGNTLLGFSAEVGETNLDAYLYCVPKYTNGLVIDDEST